MARKRNPRVDRQVHAAIAEAIESELADPRLSFVTITEVEVTPDHEYATVYYSLLDPDILARDPRRSGGDRLPQPAEVEEGLAAAAPLLRSLVGERVKLRVTPELRFRPDPVAEQAARVEALLRGLDRERDPSGGDAPDAEGA